MSLVYGKMPKILFLKVEFSIILKIRVYVYVCFTFVFNVCELEKFFVMWTNSKINKILLDMYDDFLA